MYKKITVISLLAIDRAFFEANKSNKCKLFFNASKRATIVFNGYVSEKSYATLKRIIKNKMQLKDNETFISKFIEKADICSAEEIENIDNMFAELEADMQTDSNVNIEQVLQKMNYNLNFGASLN